MICSKEKTPEVAKSYSDPFRVTPCNSVVVVQGVGLTGRSRDLYSQLVVRLRVGMTLGFFEGDRFLEA